MQNDKEKVNSVFNQLNKIDVSEYIEKKNNLNYLSWSKAWEELKKIFPTATYKVYENENGWNYFTDGKTCWVKTSVTIEGLEHIEYLPIMNNYNKSILCNAVTSVDVNKAIQRGITKAIARHGLGLYIYQGEDLPVYEQQELEDYINIIKSNMKEMNISEKTLFANVGIKNWEQMDRGLFNYTIQLFEKERAKRKRKQEEVVKNQKKGEESNE